MKTLIIFALMMLTLTSPSGAANSAMQALQIWGHDVVPSLFPYMVMCQSFIAQMKKHSFISIFAAPILGLLGGSPSGSAALAQSSMFSSLSLRSRLCLCTLTGTISPMFFLSTVSSWFGSNAAGRKLLLSHLCGACLAAIAVYLLLPTADRKTVDSVSIRQSDQSPIERSVHAILNVGGCIIFFSVAADSVRMAFPFLGSSMLAAIHATLEVSGGIKAITECSLPINSQLILCAAASGFCGFSILSQNLVFLRSFGIRLYHLVLTGMLRAAFSAAAMSLIVR